MVTAHIEHEDGTSAILDASDTELSLLRAVTEAAARVAVSGEAEDADALVSALIAAGAIVEVMPGLYDIAGRTQATTSLRDD
jgi:hypothetical protein